MSKINLGRGLTLSLAIVMAFVGAADKASAWTPGDDWKDEHCKQERDEGGEAVEVCRAIYGGGKMYLGVYWDDDSEVVGPCTASDDDPIEYKGMSRSDAVSWVDAYCN
jgi:hypothetical protein